jgi:hypothetical protein
MRELSGMKEMFYILIEAIIPASQIAGIKGMNYNTWPKFKQNF